MADALEVDGRRVSIDRIGTGSPIVCLPGGPGFPGAQLGDLGGLSRTHELLRLDLRGAGASDAPVDGRYGVVDYVADLAAVQDELGMDRIVLFGHSFGGLVAATYAAEHPDCVARLVLDATPIRLTDSRAPVGGMSGFFVDWNAFAQDYIERTMASLHEPAAMWFQANEFERVDLGPILGNITARTRVITGDRDWAVGAESAQELAVAIPDASVAIIDGAGHFAWLERPGAYVRAILDFLSVDERAS